MTLCDKSRRMLTALPVTGREGSPRLLLGGSRRDLRTVSSCFQALQAHKAILKMTLSNSWKTRSSFAVELLSPDPLALYVCEGISGETLKRKSDLD
jgi:hypothetical protein